MVDGNGKKIGNKKRAGDKETQGRRNQSQQIQVLQQRFEALSALTNRAQLAARLGSQYGGSRDLYEALGYESATSLTYKKYVTQYVRQDIARAIIKRPVDATWGGGITLLESDNENETALEKAWIELSKEFAIITRFARLDRLAGLGEYAVLLLGLDDVRVIDGFKAPVSSGKRQLKYVKPLGEDSVTIVDYVDDPKNERYGMPLHYDITLNLNDDKTQSVRVHYSRIIHVPSGELLESEIKGSPRLQAVFNRLTDLEKIIGGSAEMFWRGARPGFHGKIADDAQMTAATEGTLQDQLDEYEHNLRRFLVTSGIDIETLGSQVADPASHVDVQLQMISAVTGIPKRILTGSEVGDLASSQDKTNWLSMIQSRRDDYAEPVIVRTFINTLIEYGVLPAPNEDYTILWADLWAQSEKEKADIGKTRADALAAYGNSLVAQEIIPPETFVKFFLGLSKEEAELVEEMLQNAITAEEKESINKETEEII